MQVKFLKVMKENRIDEVIRIFANVNPLEPNCLQLVDVSTKHCCSAGYFLDVVAPKEVALLKSKGYKVRVQKSSLVYLKL